MTWYSPAGRRSLGVVPISATALFLVLVCASKTVQAAPPIAPDNVEQQGTVSPAATSADTVASAADRVESSPPARDESPSADEPPSAAKARVDGDVNRMPAQSNGATSVPVTAVNEASAVSGLEAGVPSPEHTNAEAPLPLRRPATSRSREPIRVRGFGAVGVAYTQLAERHVPAVCVEASVVIDRRWVFGGGGCGVVAEIDAERYGPAPHDPDDRLGFGYAGFITRYVFAPESRVSFSAGGLLGAGGMLISTRRHIEDGEYRGAYAEGLFLVEPQLTAQLRVTRWMRLAAYAGYRFVSPVQAAGLETSSVAGPVLGAQAQWGWF